MQIGGVLLAAGRGERLRPLTGVVPKAALPVLDVPLGAWGLSALRGAVAAAVAVNVSHLGGRVVEALRPYGDFTVLEEHPEPYGAAATLAGLGPKAAQRVLTFNADVITDLDLGELLEAHERTRGLGTVAVRRVTEGADFELDGDRAVRLVDRRIEAGAGGGMFLGVAVFEAEALRAIGTARPRGLAEGLLAPLVGRGDLAVHAHDGFALDVGTLDRYVAASAAVLEGRAPPPPGGPPGRLLEVAASRAYVGPGAVVEPASLGPLAVVLAGARVGASATLERCVVWPGATVPPGRRVADGVWLPDELTG